jgi:hypothetical protein
MVVGKNGGVGVSELSEDREERRFHKQSQRWKRVVWQFVG